MKIKKCHNKSVIFLIAITHLFFAFSCGSKKAEEVSLPPNVLNQEQFTKLLTDFALAESAANMNVKNVPMNKFDSVYAFNPLIENSIRKSQYDSTVGFYVQHPELYKKVYENVLANLTRLQTERSAKKDSVVK